jgi:hypothetical protein
MLKKLTLLITFFLSSLSFSMGHLDHEKERELRKKVMSSVNFFSIFSPIYIF